MPKSPRTRTEQPAKAPSGRRKNEKQAERGSKVDLPFATGKFHAPDLSGMRPRNVIAATRSLLPSPREAAYYGGLALLAAFEVIEWPVAVAIGVGAAVMGRGHGESGAGEKPETHEGDGHRRERAPTGRSTATSRREGTAARRSTAAARRK
ncbi:hypothetical protein [Amycolatopsis pigmentata]|uniref:Uncharacterized protein n=1 Tax=Amycolatopsis pigmentata TaxID=450801 RepID=A0ABW5G781_9PSEU